MDIPKLAVSARHAKDAHKIEAERITTDERTMHTHSTDDDQCRS